MWRTLLAWSALLLGFAALALWQHHEYQQEREAARETLRRQADAVMRALVGGVRSHRRVGPFFDEQIQAILEELTRSGNVRAAAVAAREGEVLLAAGDRALPGASPRRSEGAAWLPQGFRLVQGFRVSDAGPGGGGGFGWGRGWQRGGESASRFAAGVDYDAIIVLDRAELDRQIDRAARTRVLVVAAGGLVLLCVAAVWRATVRLARTRGALLAESRHLSDLNQAAAGLAHETRNPLGLIRGWTQQLADSGSCSPEGQRQARAVVEECDRVVARINQFLAYARPAAAQWESVDLPALVEELAVLLEPDLKAKGLTLQARFAGTESRIRADRELLRQMLFNLLQNAVEWSPANSVVEVEMARGHNGRRLAVLDRGPGVPGEKVNSLFTPYFTMRHGGTGLGLAIVRRLAAAQGWQCGYSPRRGGGAVFWIEGVEDCRVHETRQNVFAVPEGRLTEAHRFIGGCSGEDSPAQSRRDD